MMFQSVHLSPQAKNYQTTHGGFFGPAPMRAIKVTLWSMALEGHKVPMGVDFWKLPTTQVQ